MFDRLSGGHFKFAPVVKAALCALGVALPNAAWAGEVAQIPESSWRLKKTPHFDIRYQAKWSPPGIQLTLEKLHRLLRSDLGTLADWLKNEPILIYIYKDRPSYLNGRFTPPDWSEGVAVYAEKTVAVYDQKEAFKLHRIIAHETTHLLFEGYFSGKGRNLPRWLNEGLAMLMEDGAGSNPQNYSWTQAMDAMTKDQIIPAEKFFTEDLNIESSAETVNDWYLQAFSMVHFLLKKHSRLQFQNFCSRLRDGITLQEALWKTYKISSLKKLEEKWRGTLKNAGGASARQSYKRLIESVQYRSRGKAEFSPPQLR